MADENFPLTHSPHPLLAPGFPASPNLPAAFPASSDLPAFPAGSSLSYGRSDSPLPACLAPRFTQTKSRDDVAADCSMPHAFKQSLDDLCCLNLIGSRNATLEAPRSSNRAAQNKIFDDFSCLGLGLEDESDGLFRSAPQSRSVSPPPAFPPPLAVSPPLDPARAAPSSAPGAQVSAFSAALAAATGAAVKSSSAAFADQLPQLPRSAFPPFPANVPAVPLPPSRPSSSSSLPSYPLSRESLLRRPTRIILVRHGQSEGNLDEGIYTRIADSRVSLTPLGFEQAVECGKQIRKLIEFDRQKGGKQGRGGEGGKEGRRNAGGGDSGEGDYNRDEEEDDWGVYFYVSPYLRTLQTLRGIGRAFDRRHILGVRGELQPFMPPASLPLPPPPPPSRLPSSPTPSTPLPPPFLSHPLHPPPASLPLPPPPPPSRLPSSPTPSTPLPPPFLSHPLHPPPASLPPSLPPSWLQTLQGIGRAFDRRHILGVREEPRLREQDFGNFQVQERMRQIKDMRQRFGRFFYRFPEGESSADVYDRVTVMVTHGLTTRVFLMRWFRWTVRQFEGLLNPGNCEIRVMEMGEGGKYSLAVRHSEYELFSWGLTPDMIAGEPGSGQFEGLLNPGKCEIRVMEMGEGGKYSLAVRHSEYELFSWGLTPDMIADQHARMTRAVGDRKDQHARMTRAVGDRKDQHARMTRAVGDRKDQHARMTRAVGDRKGPPPSAAAAAMTPAAVPAAATPHAAAGAAAPVCFSA
ncbi:unnamed protein product [Closterium sp. NIES-64]|nr:unnamed protein product [Closterium sp. NIES-64]